MEDDGIAPRAVRNLEKLRGGAECGRGRTENIIESGDAWPESSHWAIHCRKPEAVCFCLLSMIKISWDRPHVPPLSGYHCTFRGWIRKSWRTIWNTWNEWNKVGTNPRNVFVACIPCGGSAMIWTSSVGLVKLVFAVQVWQKGDVDIVVRWSSSMSLPERLDPSRVRSRSCNKQISYIQF